MTAADILHANPDLKWRPAVIEGRQGLIGTYPNGEEIWVLWSKEKHVSGPMPWTGSGVKHALLQIGLRR